MLHISKCISWVLRIPVSWQLSSWGSDPCDWTLCPYPWFSAHVSYPRSWDAMSSVTRYWLPNVGRSCNSHWDLIACIIGYLNSDLTLLWCPFWWFLSNLIGSRRAFCEGKLVYLNLIVTVGCGWLWIEFRGDKVFVWELITQWGEGVEWSILISEFLYSTIIAKTILVNMLQSHGVGTASSMSYWGSEVNCHGNWLIAQSSPSSSKQGQIRMYLVDCLVCHLSPDNLLLNIGCL